jgi:sugar/nucleoside kinase (ribokinase family)
VRTGIAAAGNWIIDRVKLIDVYPEQDALANILEESSGNGGAPYNVLKALAKIGFAGNLEAIGLVGMDSDGASILADCNLLGIDTSSLMQTEIAPTSYTDVMIVQGTGRRTFFHQRGANALLGPLAFDFDKIRASHLHLGYLLLLDELDKSDSEFGTVAAEVLSRAKKHGMTTSIDVVSEDSDRFRATVKPALGHADIVFMNEFELSRTSGIALKDSHDHRLLQAGELLIQGITGVLVVHTPERVFAFTQDGKRIEHGSLRLPSTDIQGAVGAGDAFAAGFLAGFSDGFETSECLRFGVCVAASSLLSTGCSSGIQPWKDCLELGDRYGYYS